MHPLVFLDQLRNLNNDGFGFAKEVVVMIPPERAFNRSAISPHGLLIRK